MNTTQSTTPYPVLPQHIEAAKDYDKHVTVQMNSYMPQEVNLPAIIAAHDPHQAQNATTVRLLEEAAQRVIEFGSSIEQEPIAERLASELRAHLAKLKEGTQ